MSEPQLFEYNDLVERTIAILTSLQISAESAAVTADGLVEADARGLPSHGLMLLPMYVDRIEQGSINPAAENETINDIGALVSIDAHNGLGHASSEKAMALAIEKAKVHGIGAVAVKNAFHFGGAYRYAKMAAKEGMIGIAAANTRPLLPVPGGAKAVVGNNPIGFAVPTHEGFPVVLDIALSEVALGKIRLAEAEGREIPLNWATDSSGVPTSDPAEAIKGILLPAGGAKGFGLALIVDMLTGVLSGGGFGSQVNGLYANMAEHYNSANFFLAINSSELDPGFMHRAATLAGEISYSPMVDPEQEARLPGQRSEENFERAKASGVRLDDSVITAFEKLEDRLATRK